MPYKNPKDKRDWERQDKFKNPEKYKAKSLKDNASPKHLKAQVKWKKEHPHSDSEYYLKNKDKHKSGSRKNSLSKLGWSEETYALALTKQKGVCAICKRPCPTGRNLAADHEHTVPPKPRGLLCIVCNLMVGYAKDNPTILREAAKYLEKYTRTQDS